MENPILWILLFAYFMVWVWSLYKAVKRNKISWVIAIIFVPIFAIIYLFKKGKK